MLSHASIRLTVCSGANLVARGMLFYAKSLPKDLTRNLTMSLEEDINGKSDPYAVVGWASGEKFLGHTVHSKHVEKTLFPHWWWPKPFEDKHFDLHEKHTIMIQVWDKDLIGKDEFMGLCLLDLKHMTSSKAHQTLELALQPRHDKPHEKVTGSVSIDFIFFTEEWENDMRHYLIEQVEGEDRRAPFDLDNHQVIKIVDSILLRGHNGILASKNELVDVLRETGAYETVMQSALLGDLNVHSELPEINQKLDSNRDIVEAKQALLFKLFDADNDGTISAREVVTGIAMHSNGSDYQKAAIYFDIFDTDKDGELARDELHAVFKSVTDLWITAHAIIATCELSMSMEWKLRVQAKEEIKAVERELKNRDMALSLVSNLYSSAGKTGGQKMNKKEFVALMASPECRESISSINSTIMQKLRAPGSSARKEESVKKLSDSMKLEI